MIKVPFLLYPAKIYVAAILIGASPTREFIRLPLVSGAAMGISLDTVMLLASLVLLGVELIQQMTPRNESYVHHAISAVMAVAATLGFVVFAPLATSAWAELTAIMWVDVVVGILASARLSSGQNVWIESK